MTDWEQHHLSKGWVVTHREQETEEALRLGARLAPKRWPASVRFSFNPRLSDAEEVFLETLVESGLTQAQAEEALRSIRPILEVEFLAPL